MRNDNAVGLVTMLLILGFWATIGGLAYLKSKHIEKVTKVAVEGVRLNTCYTRKDTPTCESWEVCRPTIYKVCIIGKQNFATVMCQHEEHDFECRCDGYYHTKDSELFVKLWKPIECPR